MLLTSETFVLRGPQEDGGLDIAVTRYCPGGSAPAGDRVSLLFLHGVSYHKETWIPTIEHLFDMQANTPQSGFAVIEAWAIDSPSHGQSAILNDARLLSHSQGITAHEVARAVQMFLKSGLIAGNLLVGVAHSASVSVISLSTLGYDTGNLPYSSLILVEPPIMTRKVFARATKKGKAWELLVEMAKTRKDIWPSREAARDWMSKRLPWNSWTPRCLDLFVEYALRDLPTATYPDQTDGVTLCCTRDHEAAGYIYHQDGFDSLDRLGDICPMIPVHCIFGEKEDVVPNFVKAGFVDARQGRKMASITTVPNAGHLVVEEHPDGLAEAIWATMQGSWRSNTGIMYKL
ncbi:alpha/beta-hydrolase [Polyporus arcularius HHB13444]|uniref:Alpha/beta-hydrolase n=1 Tax=Polyporus arcularius HHB13444 TaxID=1314778 RepID=A0A5C3P9W6_9APHY|nr:alpha/beta-hydrolase [Polyporus arcularius HHB13444]